MYRLTCRYISHSEFIISLLRWRDDIMISGTLSSSVGYSVNIHGPSNTIWEAKQVFKLDPRKDCPTAYYSGSSVRAHYSRIQPARKHDQVIDRKQVLEEEGHSGKEPVRLWDSRALEDVIILVSCLCFSLAIPQILDRRLVGQLLTLLEMKRSYEMIMKGHLVIMSRGLMALSGNTLTLIS